MEEIEARMLLSYEGNAHFHLVFDKTKTEGAFRLVPNGPLKRSPPELSTGDLALRNDFGSQVIILNFIDVSFSWFSFLQFLKCQVDSFPTKQQDYYYFLVDVPGVKSISAPQFDRETNSIVLEGFRIRKFHPVIHTPTNTQTPERPNSKTTKLASVSIQYDRDAFTQTSDMNAAHGRYEGKFKIILNPPQNFDPVITSNDVEIVDGVLSVRLKRFSENKKSQETAMPWKAVFNDATLPVAV